MDFNKLSREKKLEVLETIFIMVEKEADKRAYEAGMGGHHHDGGSTVMKTEVNLYKKGMKLEMPKQWEKHLQTLDEEYDEYIRLKNKFEGK